MYLSDFIGQTKLKKRLLAVTRGDQWNILLRGHYGYGKTELAKCVAKTVGTYTYQSAQRHVTILPSAAVHILDECHLTRDFEQIYEYMTRMKFLFCTNMASKLPEPFMNRCRVMRIDEYTPGQLKRIVRNNGLNRGEYLDYQICNGLADIARGVPRSCVMLLREYLSICKFYKLAPNSADTLESFYELLGYEDGLNKIERRYLEAIGDGVHSKNTLTSLLGVDGRDLDTIERYFLRAGRLRITSKGRELV